MTRIRLDRLLSQAAGLTRKQARSEIRNRRVRLGGRLLTDPSEQVSSDVCLQWGEREVVLGGPVYLMMNKPRGLVSARCDADQATVLDLLPGPLAQRVHIVGRLDKDTTGLLLLTDDGDWSHRVSSPRRGLGKRYLAELADPLVADAERRFSEGLQLRHEDRLTRSARLSRESDTRVRVVLREGRYHQVRRMFAALGNRVIALHREAIGGLALDPALAPGQWRELSIEEIDNVFCRLD